MKLVLATLILLASATSMAKIVEVCHYNDITMEPIGQCRYFEDGRELGVPSNAAEQACTGEGTPCEVKKHSNGYVPVLSQINEWARKKGFTIPVTPEAP